MQFFLRKRYKHFRRYREIANILVKHGFGFLVHQLGMVQFLSYPAKIFLRKNGESMPLSVPVRLRVVLEELGPTFIKLGQVLSTRPDLLPWEYIHELEKLQDRVPPFPWEEVKSQVQMELGQPVDDIYQDFSREPLAAASIGQVHTARLKTGEKVVVKVQRPGIRKIIETDLEILHDVARLVDRRSPWAELYSFTDMVMEFERTLREEMDYSIEGRHADILRRNMADDPFVYIPMVYWDYTTGKILTMEFVEAVKLSNVKELEERGFNRSVIARRVAGAVLKQILIDGYFHGDPHPGNIGVLPGGRIVFMDFGLVGRLGDEARDGIVNLVLGLLHKDSEEIMRAVTALGVVPPHVEKLQLRRDVDRLRDKYTYLPLSEIKLSETIEEVLELARKYYIRIPHEFTILAKAVITTEGVTGHLDPELNIFQVAEPLGKRLVAEKLSLKELTKQVRKHLAGLNIILTRLPEQLDRVLEAAVRGELKVKAENMDVGSWLAKVNAMANRLTLSIITAALVVGSAILIREGREIFLGLPVAEIGFLTAGFLGFWIIISIIRSGKF